MTTAVNQQENQAHPLFEVLEDLHKRLVESGVKDAMVSANYYPSKFGGEPCNFNILPMNDLPSGTGATPESCLADFRAKCGERMTKNLQELQKQADSMGFQLVPKNETEAA